MEHYGSLPIPARRSRLKRASTWLLLIVLLIILGAALSGFLLYHTPDWYRPIDPATPNVDLSADAAQGKFAQLANQVQNAPIKNELWNITQDEINSIIAVRFGVADESATGATTPRRDYSGLMVYLSPGTVTIAARSTRIPGKDPNGGVISIAVTVKTVSPDPTVTSDPGNQLLIAVRGVSIGSLPVPQWLVKKEVDAQFPKLQPLIYDILVSSIGPRRANEHKKDITDVLNHIRDSQPFTPNLTTIHNRTFTFHSIRVDDGILTLELGP